MDKDLKQYLEKRFNAVDKRFDAVDRRFEDVETKIEITVNDAVESLARIIATTVAEPLERHIEETRDYPTIRKASFY